MPAAVTAWRKISSLTSPAANTPGIEVRVESGSVMAGQSVGMVNREEPVAAIIQELIDEAAAALESRG